jgi:hypothetical protein
VFVALVNVVIPAKAGIHFPAIAMPMDGFPLSRE